MTTTDQINDLLATLAHDAGIHDWQPATDDELAAHAGMSTAELALRIDIMGTETARALRWGPEPTPRQEAQFQRRLWRALEWAHGGRDIESLDGRQISGARGGAPRGGTGTLCLRACALVERGKLGQVPAADRELVQQIAAGVPRRKLGVGTKRHHRVARLIRALIA